MSAPEDNDFAELRRLLQLKRHEQPPPGYFHSFSREVISSLKAERTVRRAAPADAPAWVLRILEMFQARPAFATAVGAVVCALAIGGVLVYEKDSQRPASMPSLMSEINRQSQPAAELAGPDASATVFQPVTADAAIPLMASNSPLSSPSPSLFDTISDLETAPVGYRP